MKLLVVVVVVVAANGPERNDFVTETSGRDIDGVIIRLFGSFIVILWNSIYSRAIPHAQASRFANQINEESRVNPKSYCFHPITDRALWITLVNANILMINSNESQENTNALSANQKIDWLECCCCCCCSESRPKASTKATSMYSNIISAADDDEYHGWEYRLSHIAPTSKIIMPNQIRSDSKLSVIMTST